MYEDEGVSVCLKSDEPISATPQGVPVCVCVCVCVCVRAICSAL